MIAKPKKRMIEEYQSVQEIPLIQNQERRHDDYINEELQEEEEEGEEEKGCSNCTGDIIEELKRQLRLAVPLIAVSFLQYCLQMISIMFVGHLGELPLSSASMATSFASVTGFSVLLGMGSALETLCGQAYGAKEYHMIGIYTQRGMLVLLVLGIFLALIWFYTANILLAFGQDSEISIEAGKFNRSMIPGIFAYAILQCLNKFLQTQNIVLPMLLSSGTTTLFHVLMCWIFVFKTDLQSRGAALANAISCWINVVLLAVYVKFSSDCRKSWTGFSKQALILSDILSFLKLAIPSAVMIWSSPKPETRDISAINKPKHMLDGVHDICWSWCCYKVSLCTISDGFYLSDFFFSNNDLMSTDIHTCIYIYIIKYMYLCVVINYCSTRVSNELGAGNAKGARLALQVVVIVAISEGAFVGTITIIFRHVWGKLYSNEEEVINYVAKMLPLLALSDFFDGFQCVLSGSARGCGWQNLCAMINLGAYYVIGIPSAVLFAFVFHIGGMGLWIGIICALIVQVVALVSINMCTNWETEAIQAANRVQKSDIID